MYAENRETTYLREQEGSMTELAADDYQTLPVRFARPRAFGTVLKNKCQETFFPDDPFRPWKYESSPRRRAFKILQYFVPILEWLPEYSLSVFKYDLLAGITISTLAIPQSISYANLAKIPSVVGLYSCFVPPLVYAAFGTSRHLAVGTLGASSLLVAQTIQEAVSPATDPYLYMSLIYTAALFTGLLQLMLGVLRLGLLVDFLAHSAITGFMGGTAVIISSQQLKGILGLKHFTSKTSLIEVIKSIIENRGDFNWRCLVTGVVYMAFLRVTLYVKQKKPKLFWVSAMGPMVVVLSGCLFAYLTHAERRYGFAVVGPLKKGINAPSVDRLNFDHKYLTVTVKAGVISGFIALSEGIAIARSFAIASNKHIDPNKEMIAFGLMNVVGSMTSCYLTNGPFSKTAVNVNAGCRTPMSNAIQSVCILMVLLFLAPVFSYTPQVALSAIIITAMLGLIKYKEAYHLFKTDKCDFVICMAAFLAVIFVSMDIGLLVAVALALVRGLLYIARPSTCKLGCIPNTDLYRDVEQYPEASSVPPGFLILQLSCPIYFANANYIKERLMRWVRDEEGFQTPFTERVKYVLLDLGGVTAIDTSGVVTLFEIKKRLENNGIEIILINPRIEALEKLMLTKFIDRIGRDAVFLSIKDAIEAHRYLSPHSSSNHKYSV